jgi:hypothetical protein
VIDLKATQHGDIDMAASDEAEGRRAVEGRRSGERTDGSAAGVG